MVESTFVITLFSAFDGLVDALCLKDTSNNGNKNNKKTYCHKAAIMLEGVYIPHNDHKRFNYCLFI